VKRALGKIAVALIWMTVISGTASGQAWVSNGPFGGAIPVLAVDPTTPTTIYAGTSGSGIFKSTNSGGNWTAINNGLLFGADGANPPPSLIIEALAVDPLTPTTLYAGTDGGLFRSTDGGGSWSFVTMTVSGIPIMETIIGVVAIDPKTPTTIYAASPYGPPGGGLFKSTDAGATWTALKQGLPAYGTLPWVSILVIDPLTPTTLYAVAVASGFGNVSDVFKSTDGGASWTSASTGQPGTGVYSLAIAPTTPTSTLYATVAPSTGGGLGVFKSTNGGTTWSVVNSGLIWSVAVDPAAPTTVYAGNPNGPLYKSTDGGTSWTTITSPNNQFGNFLSTFAFGINLPIPSTIYASGVYESGGVYKSMDAGTSWSTVSSGLSRTNISSLAIDPKTPTTIYAGTGDGSGGGVFKSTDGGGSWTAAGSGLPNSPIIGANSLIIDPSTPTTLYVAGNGIHGGVGGVFKSTDGGGSWSAAGSGLPFGVQSLAINPATPTTIYVGASGVFQSTNGGGSWTPVNTGLTVNGAIPTVTALAINPVTPTTIYAMAVASVGIVLFKSANGGGSWTAVNTTAATSGFSATNVLAIDPVTPTTMYYVVRCSGTSCSSTLVKSTDGGASWSTLNIPGNVDAFAIDPTNSATLYAGLSDTGHSGSAGVLESTDGGQTWSPIDAGFTLNSVQALAIDARGSNIFAGTSGGVYSTLAGTRPAQTTTTLASSPNPSAPGQSVTFTATVTSGSGTPTGTAVFTYWGKLYTNDGGLLGCCYPFLLGTGQIIAGVGSLSVSSLPIGSDLMTAVYQPDSINFIGSTTAFLTQTVAIASVAPTSLTFSAQDIGTTSASQPVTLTNIGTGTLTIGSITTSGQLNFPNAFSQTNNCGSSLAAGGSCTINVAFTPPVALTLTGTLTITDSNSAASGYTQTVSLTGTGVFIASFTPTSLTFSAQAIGTTSAAQTETVANNLPASLIISTVTIGGTNPADFAKSSDTCTGATIPPNNTCKVSVTFTPSATGSRSASLNFVDNATNSPQSVGLFGTGTQAAITSFAPTSLTFGAQVIGTTSAAQTETVTNTGTASLTLSTVTIGGTNPGDFTKGSDTCSGATVVPNSACTVNVTFTPSATGSRSASLNFVDNASNGPQSVNLSGTGTGINNAVPTITSISPMSATAGGAALALTVNGTGFVSTSAVNFGANARATTYVSATQLTAVILASDIAATGTFNVMVTNPAPGGGTSNAVSFTVNNPVPTITSLSPSSAVAGGVAFTLTVNGTGFVSTSVVNFGANARATTYASARQLTAAIVASDIATAGTFNVTVTNPAPGGGTSNAVSFAVTDFSIAVASGGSATATVTAGQAATYNLQVTPSNGFTGTVTLTCSGAPNLATCTPAPSSPSVNGTVTPFNVNVTTTAPSIAGLLVTGPTTSPLSRSIGALLGVAMLMVLAGAAFATRRPQRALAPVLAAIALALLSGCGGGSVNTTPIGGTPKGTYMLTVTGTSGGVNRTISLTLTVN
jgi:hypothetical protein